MSHAQTVMRFAQERSRNLIPTAELERRWATVRARMSEAGLDALVIQGASAFAGGGGYFRWFTGQVPFGTYANTAIFPLKGLITLVRHGDIGVDLSLDGADATQPGIGRILTTPIFPAIHYTGGYDGDLAVRAIREAGYRTVGTVGTPMMYHGFASRLKEHLTGIELVEASDLIDDIKAIKSPEDMKLARQAATMQDEIFAAVRDHIRPGMRDFEVMAYADQVGQTLGGETGYFLGSSAPPDQPAGLRLRPQQGREIQKGDVFMFQAENSGPGGFFSHMARILVLGKASAELRQGLHAMVEAQRYMVSLLKPGTACSDAFRDYNAYMRAHGFAEERRLHCHSQGYENVERPLIRDDETMTIAPCMHFGMHPAMASRHVFVTVCDNFLIGADGAVERLHQTPQEIFEV